MQKKYTVKKYSKKYNKQSLKLHDTIKSFINNKHNKHDKRNNHYYFINRCANFKLSVLDDTILEQYLKRLGCIPDNAMFSITKQQREYMKRTGITYKEFCTNSRSHNKLHIRANIKADIFFYRNYATFIDKYLYNYTSFLVNTLNINKNITNKDVIYDNIASVDARIPSKYLIPTFPIKDYKKYKFPEYYILRPNDSFSGANIKYISSRNELDDAIKYYETSRNYRGIIHGDDVTASPYITDLLLFRGRKFHLRMYYIVSCIDGLINSHLLDNADIYTASGKFDLEFPFTKDKHDTHFNSTGEDLTIKEHFTKDNLGIEITPAILEDIFQKCKIICSGITKMIIKKVIGKDYDKYSKEDSNKILFENHINGYHIYGLDMFITKDLKPILIECNESPGFDTFTYKGRRELSLLIYELINSAILEPLLKYNDPMIARKHKTYIHLE